MRSIDRSNSERANVARTIRSNAHTVLPIHRRITLACIPASAWQKDDHEGVRRPTIIDWAAGYTPPPNQPTYLLHVTVGCLGWSFSACASCGDVRSRHTYYFGNARTHADKNYGGARARLDGARSLSLLSDIINRGCVRCRK